MPEFRQWSARPVGSAVSIRLHPKVIHWAKDQAKRRHVGYQTMINEVLLKVAARTVNGCAVR